MIGNSNGAGHRSLAADRSQQCFNLAFVKTGKLRFSSYEYRTLQQIRVPEHELYRLVFRRWFLLHVFFPVEGSSRIQEIFDRIVADDLAQLFLGERMLAVFSLLELDFVGLQETSCFTACRSRCFVDKFNFVGHDDVPQFT